MSNKIHHKRDYIPGGIAKGLPDSEFDPVQLKKGVDIELEHTTDHNIAKEIAKDHLKEDPKYYIKLHKMETEQLHEASGTLLAGGKGGGYSRHNDDGDSNDDDEEWKWDNLHQYDRRLITWSQQSPCVTQIKRHVLTTIFNDEPTIDIKEQYSNDSDNDNEQFGQSGTLIVSVEWSKSTEDYDIYLYHTLSSTDCDLHKVFNIDRNQVWNLLDKGDVLEYIWYHIKAALVGFNIEYVNKFYHPDRREGEKFDDAYFTLNKQWRSDKLTLEKYTKFMLYDRNDYIISKIYSMLPDGLQLYQIRQRVNALIWEDHFRSHADIWYEYTSESNSLNEGKFLDQIRKLGLSTALAASTLAPPNSSTSYAQTVPKTTIDQKKTGLGLNKINNKLYVYVSKLPKDQNPRVEAAVKNRESAKATAAFCKQTGSNMQGISIKEKRTGDYLTFTFTIP